MYHSKAITFFFHQNFLPVWFLRLEQCPLQSLLVVCFGGFYNAPSHFKSYSQWSTKTLEPPPPSKHTHTKVLENKHFIPYFWLHLKLLCKSLKCGIPVNCWVPFSHHLRHDCPPSPVASVGHRHDTLGQQRPYFNFMGRANNIKCRLTLQMRHLCSIL